LFVVSYNIAYYCVDELIPSAFSTYFQFSTQHEVKTTNQAWEIWQIYQITNSFRQDRNPQSYLDYFSCWCLRVFLFCKKIVHY